MCQITCDLFDPLKFTRNTELASTTRKGFPVLGTVVKIRDDTKLSCYRVFSSTSYYWALKTIQRAFPKNASLATKIGNMIWISRSLKWHRRTTFIWYLCWIYWQEQAACPRHWGNSLFLLAALPGQTRRRAGAWAYKTGGLWSSCIVFDGIKKPSLIT